MMDPLPPAAGRGTGHRVSLRIWLIAAVLVLMTLILAPFQLAAMRVGGRWSRRLPMLWHRVACRLIGLRVRVRGRPAAERPLLIASNHQSWADIVSLGSVMPLCFIAKSEVNTWPGFNILARLQRTVFVERNARGRVGEQADAIARRLNSGDVMVLFAEGTTSDGNQVLPFKSSLFGAAQASLRQSRRDAVLVQPVSVAYTAAHGLPLGCFGRPLAAWPGDVPLIPHLVGFLREGAIDVEVSFGEPIRFDESGNRKAVALRAERAAAALLARSLHGEGTV